MRLEELRKEKKINQRELGNIVGLKPNTICSYEHGWREPNIKTLIIFADLFNVSIDYLVGRSEKRK